MKKALAATALAATLLAGSAVSSFASTTDTQDLGSFSSSDTVSFSRNRATSSFTDYFTFTLENTAKLATGSITNSFTQMSQFIQKFTISLYSGTVGSSSNTLIASATTNQASDGTAGPSPIPYNGTEATSIKGYNLGAGKYYLQVTGTTGSASYGGSLAISAVPLPGTVALFGVALAGLGVVGAMRRKSVTSVA